MGSGSERVAVGVGLRGPDESNRLFLLSVFFQVGSSIEVGGVGLNGWGGSD